jgi:hypothetical protein
MDCGAAAGTPSPTAQAGLDADSAGLPFIGGAGRNKPPCSFPGANYLPTVTTSVDVLLVGPGSVVELVTETVLGIEPFEPLTRS